jgi:hypothetical protein
MLRRFALLLVTCTTCLSFSQTVAGALEVVATAESGAMAGSEAIAQPSMKPQAIGWVADHPAVGEAGWELRQAKAEMLSELISQVPTSTPTETSTPKSADQLPWQWWAALTTLGVLSGAAVIRYGINRFKSDAASRIRQSFNSSPKAKQTVEIKQVAETVQTVETIQTVETRTEPIANSAHTENNAHIENSNGYLALPETPSDPIANKELVDSSTSFMQETTRLPKINIREELIRELHSLDPIQRRKAIWELGQQGDSQAIQPLVDLMMDSDSNQRSLILAAISEIGVRTLKPMNRALIISLQDESSDVRKNAIRDLTRIYDQIAQMSQLLGHAVNDADPEVQETAQWALSQLNRIRTIAGPDNTPLLTNSTSAPEYLPGDQSSLP